LLAVLVAGPVREAGRKGAVADLLCLGGGFLLVSLPWLVPLAARIGAAGVAEKVFFFGAGARTVVDAYLLEAPPWHPGTLVLLCAAAGAMGLARTSAARLAPVALGLGAVLAAGSAVVGGILPLAENLLFWSGPAALVFGLVSVGPAAGCLRERILLIFTAFTVLTIYPRPDLIHIAQIAPVLLLAGLATWRRAVDAWHRALPGGRAAHGIAPQLVLGFFLLLACGRMAPTLLPRLLEPLATLELGPGVEVQVLETKASDYQALGRLVAEIRALTGPEETLFTFPDLGGLAFLAQRPSPFYYIYFVPGRPDHAQAARIREEWRRLRPALALIGAPRVPAFAASSEYFVELLAFVDERTTAGPESWGVALRPARP
ncbi:MAG: hypothetical protein VCC00_13340, partial [Deltaproteobacteria bacterium]